VGVKANAFTRGSSNGSDSGPVEFGPHGGELSCGVNVVDEA